jgi:transcriptional regulator with XRE-family HTH domain
MDAASLLQMARRRAGLSQRELSRRAAIPQPSISRIERGLTTPTFDTLLPLIRACGMQLVLSEPEGVGIDVTLLDRNLRLSPPDRLRRIAAGSRWLEQLRNAREVAS